MRTFSHDTVDSTQLYSTVLYICFYCILFSIKGFPRIGWTKKEHGVSYSLCTVQGTVRCGTVRYSTVLSALYLRLAHTDRVFLIGPPFAARSQPIEVKSGTVLRSILCDIIIYSSIIINSDRRVVQYSREGE